MHIHVESLFVTLVNVSNCPSPYLIKVISEFSIMNDILSFLIITPAK